MSFTFSRIDTGGVEFLIPDLVETKWPELSGVVVLASLLIVAGGPAIASPRISEMDDLLILLIGWMAVTMTWTPDPGHGFIGVVYGSLLLALCAIVRLL